MRSATYREIGESRTEHLAVSAEGTLQAIVRHIGLLASCLSRESLVVRALNTGPCKVPGMVSADWKIHCGDLSQFRRSEIYRGASLELRAQQPC